MKGVARKLAVDSLAFIDTRAAAEALISLAVADSAVDDQATWWLKNRSEGEWSAMNLDPVLRDQGITNKPAELVSITVPAKPKEVKFTVAEVLKLEGDAVKGKQLAPRTSHLAPRCVMCHQIDGQGAEYGPALKGFGKPRLLMCWLAQSLIRRVRFPMALTGIRSNSKTANGSMV